MAKAQSKSSLAGKLGPAGKQAVEEHRNDETKYGAGGGLPAGIQRGVAQLTECKFGVYEKGDFEGEYFFYAAGTVLAPAMHEGLPIKGERTQIGPIPICDTPNRTQKTVADHLATVLNEMRKLGVDTTDVSVDDLESVAEELKKAAPIFKFRTWASDKQEIEHKNGKIWVGKKSYANEAAAKAANPYLGKDPLVNHQWSGLTDFNVEDGDGGVTDGDATPSKAKPHPADNTPAEEVGNDEDLAALGEAADNGDADATARLTELGEAAGLDLPNINTWVEVAQALTDAAGDGGGEGGEGDATATGSDEPAPPAKGDLFYYKPPRKSYVECEVTAVQAKEQTVSLKNLDDGKTVYTKVAWDKLMEEKPA